MVEKEHHYFKNATEWRNWLHENHRTSKGVYLIFYKIDSPNESMRWEEAVQVAISYGWIDSTVKKLDFEKRRQTFTLRKNHSVWSKLNKSYVEKLLIENQIHKSGLDTIEIAKHNGSWNSLDKVEDLVIPTDLKIAFSTNTEAYNNYLNFSPSYKKSYLYWLNQAKREQTRINRINEIINCCEQNMKSRN